MVVGTSTIRRILRKLRSAPVHAPTLLPDRSNCAWVAFRDRLASGEPCRPGCHYSPRLSVPAELRRASGRDAQSPEHLWPASLGRVALLRGWPRFCAWQHAVDNW